MVDGRQETDDDLNVGEIARDGWQRFAIWGAYASDRNMDRNFRGAGGCMIGNLYQTPVPEWQYQALVRLEVSNRSKLRG